MCFACDTDILIVQPHFELGSFFFADNDLSVIGRNNTNQHFAVKIVCLLGKNDPDLTDCLVYLKKYR